MIIETHTNPEAVWDEREQAFVYKFMSSIAISVEKIATAKPGFYRPVPGSIISIGGPEFGIEFDYDILVKAMKRCHELHQWV